MRRPLALGAAATIGFGSLFFANAAFAEEGEAPATTESQAVQGAVASLDDSDKYEFAAAQTNTSAADVKQQEAAGALLVSENGFVAHVDPAHSHSDAEFEAAQAPGDPVGGSLPGAPVTIFLDFDGATLEGTNWNVQANQETLTYAPGTGIDPAQVWASVAEDYAPFNINVTTVDPGEDALVKSSDDDNQYGSHVIITDSPSSSVPGAEGAGGVAWLGGAGSDFLSGAFVFTPGTGSSKAVAEAASHEAGHNFGLSHDGHSTEEYYYPTEGLWGPIMGAGYGVPVTQWSNGDYNGATRNEDDLSVITDRASAEKFVVSLTYVDGGESYEGPVCNYEGSDYNDPQPGDQFQVPNSANECDGTGEILDVVLTFTDRAEFRADDHGDDAASATTLDNASGSFEEAGVIETSDDVDAFNVTTEGGAVSATVNVADQAANLNAKLTLVDSDGTVVAEDEGNPQRESETVATGLGATVSAENVEAGTYTLLVEGIGFGDPSTATLQNANGFSAYGSLGNYTVTGTAAPGEEQPEAPDAPVISSPEEGVTYEAITEITGTGVAGATIEMGGALIAETTVDEEGNWSVPAELTEDGDYTISATQTVDELTSDPTVRAFSIEAADSGSDAGGDDNGAADGGDDAGSDGGSNGGSDSGATGGTDGSGDSGAGDSEAGTNDGDLANTGFETQSLLPYLLGAVGMIALGGAAIVLARRKTAGDEI